MEHTKLNRTHHKRRRFAAPVGGVFLVLVVIGIIAVVLLSLDFTRKMIDNSNQKADFEKQILPVLMFDPVPFERATDVDNLVLLQDSVWAALLGDKRGSYQYDETGMISVPASDVEVAAAKLFGPDVVLEHQSFGNIIDTSYIYDEETKTYRIPVMGQTGLYTPRVVKIEKKSGNVLELTVGYIPPASIWSAAQEGEDGETQPDKYMIYEMTKANKSYYVSAIRDVTDPKYAGTTGMGVQLQQPPSQQPTAPETQPAQPGSGDSSSSEAGSSEEASSEEASSDAESSSSQSQSE